MTILAFILVPAAAGLAALALPNSAARARRVLLPAAAAAHAALTAAVFIGKEWNLAATPWLGLDPVGLLFLLPSSALFLLASFSAVGDLARSGDGHGGGSERVYIACLLFFLATLSAVALAQDMGMMWVAVEATTLATAPLIYFHRNAASLEATWKYLLICSFGIALALLGTFLMAVAAGDTPDGSVTLNIRALAAMAPGMDPAWLRAAFIFILVGYGAKMGLAPMHTWLPDAHSEAPAPVSALLSGTLLNGAFLAILRAMDIMQSAGMDEYSRELMRFLGLLSMALAGAFILGQRNYKRLLAYSSVEHMGILAFGAGLGGAGLWAALLHAFNHTLVKGCLFLTAGNILRRHGSKSILAVTGLRRSMPITGPLWLAGILAICGMPPFGIFVSEFAMLRATFAGGRYWEGGLFLLFLAVVFVGMLTAALSMLRGSPPPSESETGHSEPVWPALPPLILAGAAVLMGMAVPVELGSLIGKATAIIDTVFTTLPGIRP